MISCKDIREPASSYCAGWLTAGTRTSLFICCID